jgi:hypothetical protein
VRVTERQGGRYIAQTGGDVTNMYTLHAFFEQYDKCETYCERITN